MQLEAHSLYYLAWQMCIIGSIRVEYCGVSPVNWNNSENWTSSTAIYSYVDLNSIQIGMSSAIVL